MKTHPKKSSTKQRSGPPLTMPVGQESSLFLMTPEQHQKMVEQIRAEFMMKINKASRKS